ncbi:hypothetical protein EW146_g840 [Bondarzewia mesenterica]|uniref:ATP-dependent DNA helicase CHL1 n=1 Tax=Bondarzewia mesenterica TaxID=1095465 RepID=A0A4S4M7J8_9AGAM|nr:hypothetical protein EW146_g840 [Bondarzewia mesenterica]
MSETATAENLTKDSLTFPTPENFPAFPYQPPYDIQTDLMRHLYTAIEQRKVAIVESPTGTKYSPDDSFDVDDDAFLPEDASSSNDAHADSLPSTYNSLQRFTGALNSTEQRPACRKIFYASRTHSQLSQVIPELTRLRRSVRQSHVAAISADGPMPNPKVTSGKKRNHLAVEVPDGDEDVEQPRSRAVALGSRKQLCINGELKRKSGDLDENCRELLNVGAAKNGKRCPYLPKLGEEYRLQDFRDEILSEPKDIEDLVLAGEAAHICPYFGSREAIAEAEVVTLPYNLLLQPTARQALNIDLSDQIVVIDEAHNLIQSLLSLSTVALSLNVLTVSLNQLSTYLSKYQSQAFKVFMTDWRGQRKQGSTEVMTVDAILQKLGRKLEGINLLEIQEYIRSSKIARKVAAFSKHIAENGTDKVTTPPITSPPLHVIESFIFALTKSTDDGRVILAVSQDGQAVEARYQSLNPSPAFREVVDAARSVILAGGTLSPISDLTTQLFSYLSQDKVSVFSCRHIIPSANLQTLVVGKGPRGGDLNFKFSNLSNQSLIIELGQLLLNLARLVPGGMVVFLPSYRVLNQALSVWKEGGLIHTLQFKKKIFVEPSASNEVDAILHEYTIEVQKSLKRICLKAMVLFYLQLLVQSYQKA